MLSRVVYTLFGEPRTSTLEHRLFNTISLLNGVANLGGAVVLTATGEAFSQRLLHAGTGVVFLGCYYLSRFRGVYAALYWPFVLLILGFLLANALGNAGTLGGGHYYLIPALVIATILARSTRRVLVAGAIFATASAALVVVEIEYPSLVTPYAHAGDRTFDVGGNLVFVELFTAALVLILTKNLNQERHKSDLLLLNILPETVAEELKRDDRVQPRAYESATVLFTDCVGFTRIAEGLTAEGLVEALDDVFSRFDAVAHAHGLEKIKTIGDSYMAVGGVPVPNRTHAIDCVLAALEFRDAVEQIRSERAASGSSAFEIRIGLHTGPLVAGVIGRTKFAYDVWGDTVNTASRMESSGAPGRVNISLSTYERVAAYFDCEHRGKIAAKNKGEIDMYFVRGLREELSENGDGRTPNARCRALRNGKRSALGRNKEWLG
jgi:adenylate cyclase